MHSRTNKEIKNAYEFLRANQFVKNQTELSQKMKVTKGLVSNVLGGRVAASVDFKQKFEGLFLTPRGMSWKSFTKKMRVHPVAEEDATEGEHILAKVVHLEALVVKLIKIVKEGFASQPAGNGVSESAQHLDKVAKEDRKGERAQALKNGTMAS